MGEIANLGNGRHPKSLARDGRFMAALVGARYPAGAAKGEGTSVSKTRPLTLSPLTSTSYPLTPTSAPSPSSSEIIKQLEAELAALDLESEKPARPSTFALDARKLWQRHQWPAEALAALPRQYRTPAPWRDASPLLALAYAHRALRERGSVYSFTLNLDPDVEALAKGQDDTARWLHKRLARRLEQSLGRRVDLWFVLEDMVSEPKLVPWRRKDGKVVSIWSGANKQGPRNRRLHLHGAMAITADEAVEARAALRRAGGEWEEVQQHQSHTAGDPDYGWVGYSAKRIIWHSPAVERLLDLVGDRHRRKTFNGPSWAASATIRSRAEALYKQDRLDTPRLI